MDLKVPIALFDELAETVIKSTGLLDLASGEIRNVVYEDYDVKTQGLPADNEEYEFTSGTLSNDGKDVEFGVNVDVFSGKYSVTANELLLIQYLFKMIHCFVLQEISLLCMDNIDL